MGRAKPFRGSIINAAHPLGRGLFNCWLMNEGCGGVVFDSVERRRGDFYCGVQWKPGSDGWCVETDGSSGYLVLAGDDDRYAADSGFSWSVRVMFTELPSIAGTGIVLDYKTVSGHSWYLQGKSWDDGIGIHFSDGGYTTHLVNGPTIEKGRWYDVAFVFNGYEIFLYVDGRMADTTEPGSVYRQAGSSLHFGHPGSYSPEARCSHVMFWDRALSAAEVRLLAREPYAMFERPCGRENFVHVLGLSGSIAGDSEGEGHAGLACRGSWRGGGLDIERKWLRGALFGGMDSDAFKLGTALSGGWFWMRRLGCSGLYRGETLDGVGFEGVVAVGAVDVDEISPPACSPHNSGAVYYYLVRRFNELGVVEQTTAGVRVGIGEDGQLESARPQAVGGLRAFQIGQGRVRLEWFYDSMGQAAAPAAFDVYGDDGCGRIDFDSALGAVEYAGRRFYGFEYDGLSEGLHAVAVCGRSSEAVRGRSAVATVSVSNAATGGIEIVGVDSV